MVPSKEGIRARVTIQNNRLYSVKKVMTIQKRNSNKMIEVQ